MMKNEEKPTVLGLLGQFMVIHLIAGWFLFLGYMATYLPPL